MKFDRRHSFRYAVEERVAPGLVRITARNPGAFTFHGTGTYLIGRDRALIIDPGPKIQEHFDVLSGCVSANLEQVLVTHRHQDHAGLAPAIAALATVPVAAFGGECAHTSEHLDGEDPEPDFHPEVPLSDGDVIEVGDVALCVMHTPGHTADHLCFIDSRNRRVFCGDQVMAWSTTVILPPDGHLGRYLDSLERLKELSDHVFWPTHGPPITKPGPFIDQLLAHRCERERQLLEALANGPADSDTLVSRVYRKIEPNLRAAAHQSLLAGLLWLEERGCVVRENDTNEAPLFRLA